MFKIQRNQVFLSRGESAVYAREITLDDKYRTPYMLLASYDEPKVSVKLKANKNDKEAIVEWINNIGDELPRFTTKNVVNIDSTTEVEDEGVLYRLKEDGKYTYYYLKDGEPTIYRCVLRFTIQSSDTQKLRPATYFYSITFLAGTEENDYKEVWLEPTEFIIGGSY